MRLLSVLLCLISTTAGAAGLETGTYEIFGGFDFSDYGGRGFGYRERLSSIQVSAGAQYFVKKKLSAGLELGYRNYTRGLDAHGSIAPIATYYFLTSERIAPFVTLSPVKVFKEEAISARVSSGLKLGTKFFLTESVAFGPAFDYEHRWSTGPWGDSGDRLSFLGQFSVFL